MPITIEQTVIATANRLVVDISSSLDADTAASFPHGMASTPEVWTITPRAPAFHIGQWAITGTDAVNFQVTKINIAASSGVGVCRVVLETPHSVSG